MLSSPLSGCRRFFAAAEQSGLLRIGRPNAPDEKGSMRSRAFRLAFNFSSAEIVRDGFPPSTLLPFFKSRFACRRAVFEVEPFFAGGNFTPARRAFDKPIAIARLLSPLHVCLHGYAPFPLAQTLPACVEADLPSRASSRARSIVSSSGIYN